MSDQHLYDVLIIGSGASGLGMALRLDSRLKVAVISKRELREGNTLYAQGGISAVLSDMDSIESHVQDTLIAGAGLCDEATVRLVVEHGPKNIHWLLDEGVEFTRQEKNNPESGFHLTREGGHSHRRVVHSADSTGRAVETTLVQQALEADNIDIFEHHIAVDLILSVRHGKTRRVLGA